MAGLAAVSLSVSLAIWALAPSATESADANGDTRTLHLYHTHTGETIDATFRLNGRYDPAVLAQLNHFLRDWRNNDEHQMDPRLFDAVWEAYRTAGATDRIQIYSAYRSPETNAMLRHRSHAVAEHSQHMLGKAMDTTMPGFPMERIREAGMKLEHGGVGWYPSSNFVHLDVGSVRSWPRMSYDQLARIFPDGRTVHIAADGRTLPGYDEARTEIVDRGGTDVPPAKQSSGFFAWLFGGGGSNAAREDEEDRRAPAPVAVASVPQEQATVPQSQPPQPQLAQAQGPQDLTAPVHGTQLASLETSDDVAAPVAALPMPPPRPADLAEADIPMPPVRPDALDRLQTASVRYIDGGSMPRRAPLPTLITRGGVPDRSRVPNQMLAFAAVDAGSDLQTVPLPVARPANLSKPLALRSARRRALVALAPDVPQVVPQQVADTSVGSVSIDAVGIVGPHVTGLRRAARAMSDKASL